MNPVPPASGLPVASPSASANSARSVSLPIPVRLDRLQADFEAFAAIGRTAGGGSGRLAFSEADRQGRAFIRERMAAAGLEVYEDPAGNIHGYRRGMEEGLRVATGSHSDSVENGGHFDGAVGLLGGLEVLRALREAGIVTRRGLEVISFLAEEPNRFGLSCIGSRGLCGRLSRRLLEERRDPEGRSLAEALQAMGVSPESLLAVKPGDFRYHAFIEVHVEQGRTLYDRKVPLGLVTDIVGAYRYRVRFVGQADHAGGTPMDRRRDALAAAAEGVLAVERICRSYHARDIVGTVGVLRVVPGAINVIPGECEMILEVRGRAHFPKSIPVAEIRAAFEETARRREVALEVETLMEDESRTVSPLVQETIASCAESLGYPYLRMPSRTGHDAMHLAEHSPVGMIFLPSREGIGHHPAEWTDWEDIERGLKLLAASLVRLADEDERDTHGRGETAPRRP